MAATAVYARVAAVPTGGKSQIDEGFSVSNISATSGAKTLTGGGLYGMTVKASTYGTVALQILGPDDTTWLAVAVQNGATGGYATTFAADGYGTVYLPPGQYRIAIA
jgi:hypothetical protein